MNELLKNLPQIIPDLRIVGATRNSQSFSEVFTRITGNLHAESRKLTEEVDVLCNQARNSKGKFRICKQ